jgi:hypothetical protein
MKAVHQYDYLLNQDKVQILQLLGQEFNFYPSNIWTYVLKTRSFWRRTVMFIFFENEKVFKIEIKVIYGKISTRL